MKKIISLLLCVMLVVTMMPVMAWAETTTSPTEGDYRIDFTFPSHKHYFLKGMSSTVVAELQQYQTVEGKARWLPVDEDSYTITATSDATLNNEEPLFILPPEPGNKDLNIGVSGGAEVNTSGKILVTAKIGDEKVAETTIHIEVVDTIYTLPDELPNPLLGGTLNLTQLMTLTAENLEVEDTVITEGVSWSVDDYGKWLKRDASDNGMCNLLRKTPKSIAVRVEATFNGANIASKVYEFSTLSNVATWTCNVLEVSESDTEREYVLNAENIAPKATINFEIGTGVDSGFAAFENSSTMFTQSSNVIKLDGTKIKAVLGDGKDFTVKTIIKYGETVLWETYKSGLVSEASDDNNQGTDTDDPNAEYRFDVGTPNSMYEWLPGTETTIWTQLEKKIWENQYDYSWHGVNGYTLEKSAVMTHTCGAQAGVTFPKCEYASDCAIKLPDTCVKGCSATITIKALLGSNVKGEKTFTINTAEEMYKINRPEAGFNNNAKLGEIVTFKDSLTVQKKTNGRWEDISKEDVSFSMAYEADTWQQDDEGINGLYNLKRVSPYGCNVTVKVIAGGKEVAQTECGFNHFDYWAELEQVPDETILESQGTCIIDIEKSEALSDSTCGEATISFALGEWQNNTFVKYVDQSGITAVTDSTGAVTGVEVNCAQLASNSSLKYYNNGNSWIEVAVVLSYNGNEFRYGTTGFWFEKSLKYRYEFDTERTMVIDSTEGFGRVKAIVRDAEGNETAYEQEITNVSVVVPDGETDPKIIEVSKDKYGWRITAKKPGFATLAIEHEAYSSDGQATDTVIKNMTVEVIEMPEMGFYSSRTMGYDNYINGEYLSEVPYENDTVYFFIKKHEMDFAELSFKYWNSEDEEYNLTNAPGGYSFDFVNRVDNQEYFGIPVTFDLPCFNPPDIQVFYDGEEIGSTWLDVNNVGYGNDEMWPTAPWRYATKNATGAYEFIDYSGQDRINHAGLYFVDEHVTIADGVTSYKDLYIMLECRDNYPGETLWYESFHSKEAFTIGDAGDINIANLTPTGPVQVNGTDYLIWKVIINNVPSADKYWRMKTFIGDESGENRDHEIDIFFFGSNYERLDKNSRIDGVIPLSTEITGGNWSTYEGFEKAFGDDIISEEFYLNMSKEPSDSRNTIYLLHKKGTTLQAEVGRFHAKDLMEDASSFSEGVNGRFLEMLGNGGFILDDTGKTVTINNVEYSITKANLKEFLGREYLVVKFYDNNTNATNPAYTKFNLYSAMDIRITGAVEGLKFIQDTTNSVHDALGYDHIAEPFAFEKVMNGENEELVSFYKDIFTQYDVDGQGNLIRLDIQLEDGYVIDSITGLDENGNAKEYDYVLDETFLYYLYKDDVHIYTEYDLVEVEGWDGALSGSTDPNTDDNVGIVMMGAFHTLAGTGEFSEHVGAENLTRLGKFLDAKNANGNGAEYTAVLRGNYIEYDFYPDNATKHLRNEITIHISKAEVGDEIGVHGDKVDIDTDDNNLTQEEIEGKNVLLHKLYSNDKKDWYTVKSYEITQAEGSGDINGFIYITIPRSEFHGNPEKFEVFYFTEDGTPILMETTHTEKGIVFLTGHFSEYAVVSTVGADYKDDDNSGNTDSGTTDIYIPVTPSTPKDEVTNQAGTTTTAPSTNADLSGSTTTEKTETGDVKAETAVDKTTADKIVENAVANKSEEVVIDATTETKPAGTTGGGAAGSTAETTEAAVTLPTETIQQIAEKTDADVTIKTDVAEIKLDTQALAAIADQADDTDGSTISIVAVKTDEELCDEGKEVEEVHFELKVVCSERGVIGDFKGGKVSVTVPLHKDMHDKDVTGVYIDGNRHWHKVKGGKNADNTYTFHTDHFSSYAIVTEETADATIAAQKEAVKDVQLKLRSANSKTSKGKKAIKLTVSEVTDTGIDFDGYVIYRSKKKTSGYKKIYTTKTGTYFNTSAKKGVKYYYKAKGFVTIDGEKVYTGWSKKAIRTAK